MVCNGFCRMCPNPCPHTVIINKAAQTVSKEEEKGASEAFDKPVIQVEDAEVIEIKAEDRGLAVVDNTSTYQVTKNIFGKERVRKVK